METEAKLHEQGDEFLRTADPARECPARQMLCLAVTEAPACYDDAGQSRRVEPTAVNGYKQSVGDKGKRPYMRMAMAANGQVTGMRGVYLVAAELSRLGLLASPTSRSAKGADILATTGDCTRAFSVQVKSNAKTFNFWLVGKDIPVSQTHIYVFVNLRAKKGVEAVDFYVVPSTEVAKRVKHSKASTGSEWYLFFLKDAQEFKDNWKIFEPSARKTNAKLVK